MSKLASASSMGRAVVCPASQILPTARVVKESIYATKGTDGHDFLKRVANAPDREAARAQALEEMSEDSPARKVCAAIDLREIPRGGIHELAIAYDPTTDTARELGRDIGREYEAHGANREEEITASADLAGVVVEDGERIAVVPDWKFGVRAGAARKSWQMRTLGLLVARLFGVEKARCTHYHIDDDGEVRKGVPLIMDAFDLAAHAGALLDYKQRHQELVAEYRVTRRLPVVAGDHCTKPFVCDAYLSCPATSSLLRAALTPEDVPAAMGSIEQLDDVHLHHLGAQVKLAYAMSDVLKRFLAQADDYARLLPRGIPIIGESGEEEQFLVELEGTYKDKIVDAKKAEEYLERVYGTEVAAAAVKREPEATKGGIEEAVKAWARANGRKVKDAFDDACRGLRECGAMTREQGESKVKLVGSDKLAKKALASKRAA